MAEPTPSPAAAMAAESRWASMLIRRWAALSIDVNLMTLVVFLSGFLLGSVHESSIHTAGIGLTALGALAYLSVAEARTGRTVGKWVAGLVVMNDLGHRPSAIQAVLRMLMRVVELSPLALGGLVAGVAVMLTPGRQRLGDMLTRTYVLPVARVRAWRSRPGVEAVF